MIGPTGGQKFIGNMSKGGGGMAPLVASALISGGTQLLGGLLGSRASNKAGEREYRAAMEALAYQKEQDAYRRKIEEEERAYQRSQDAYQRSRYEADLARLAPYRALSQSILGKTAARLGLQLPANAGSGGIAPMGMIPERATASSGSMMAPQTLADIAMSEGLPASATASFVSQPSRRRLTLADLASWSDVPYRA